MEPAAGQLRIGVHTWLPQEQISWFKVLEELEALRSDQQVQTPLRFYFVPMTLVSRRAKNIIEVSMEFHKEG